MCIHTAKGYPFAFYSIVIVSYSLPFVNKKNRAVLQTDFRSAKANYTLIFFILPYFSFHVIPKTAHKSDNAKGAFEMKFLRKLVKLFAFHFKKGDIITVFIGTN